MNEDRLPQAGDWVFWYLQGDFGAKPLPAMVTQDTDAQRAMMLEVHAHGYITYVNASKHMNADATEIDRERNGGWSWARTIEKKKA